MYGSYLSDANKFSNNIEQELLIDIFSLDFLYPFAMQMTALYVMWFDAKCGEMWGFLSLISFRTCTFAKSA